MTATDERKRLVGQINVALPELRDRSELVDQVTGKQLVGGYDVTFTTEEYREIVEAIPEYLAQKQAAADAEAARIAEEARNPAAKRLAALEQAARDGAPVTAEALALARAQAEAEADLVRLAEIGAAERAKAEKAAHKRREAAKQAVRENPPVLPDGVADAAGRAAAAIAELKAMAAEYGAQVSKARATLEEAGAAVLSPCSDQSDDCAFDAEFHGIDHLNAVVIDGKTLGVGDVTQHLRVIADSLTAYYHPQWSLLGN